MTDHRRLPVCERFGDGLVLTCPYIVDVEQERPGIHNRNAMPWARMFCADPAVAERGSVTDLAARRRIALAPGRLVLLPPDRLYAFDFEPGMRMAAFHFRLEGSPGCDVFAGLAPAWRDDAGALAAAVCTAARRGEDFAAAVALRGLLLQAAALFAPARPPSAGRFAPVLAAIEARCRADLGVAGLARTAGMGREHFARSFRRQLGVSPREHLHRRLTRHACVRLLAGAKVKEVAAELGFSSEFVFSRFFRRRTGGTASAFRISG